MNKLKLTCLAAAIGVISSGANALLITEWNYLNDAGFTNYVTTDGTAAGITPSGSTNAAFDGTDLFGGSLPTNLAWGSPYKPKNPDENQSAIAVTGAQSGQISTSVVDGQLVGAAVDWSTGTGLVHENWGVSGSTLAAATLMDGLLLGPAAPFALPMAPAPVLEFGVVFEETYNHNDPGEDRSCPYGEGTSAQSGTVNENGCSDLFTIVLPGDVSYVQAEGYTYLTNSFMLPDPTDIGLDEYLYTLTTRLSGIEVIEGVDCLQGATCLGFLTKENQTNSLLADFSIAATRVAEPGTLAIFGLGLFGLAAARRRRS